MTQDMEFGSLKLTPKTYEVFKGSERVWGKIVQMEVDYDQRKESECEYDHGLFELLRRKRKELADKANVPPYVIFPDKTLIEIAVFFPQSKDNLLNMHGVGSARFEKYGDIFLNIIKHYCLEHHIQEQSKHTTSQGTTVSKKKPRLSLKRKHVIVGEAYSEGASIREIMTKFGIKLDTVLNHLSKYLEEGHTIRSEGLLKVSALTSDQQTAVIKTIDKFGTGYLRPIFEAMKETISYTEIKVLHLYYL